MKNKLIDLNDHLFAALERVNEEGISKKKLDMAIKQSKEVASIAKEIVRNASLSLQAEKLRTDGQLRKTPAMIEHEGHRS